MKVLVNGELRSEQDATISVFDHGLLYGDGVFEGIRVYHGKVFKLEDHVRRLYDSARAIALSIPIGEEAMAADVVRTCAANGIHDGYVRLVVTRGVGTLGLNPYLCEKAQVIIIAANIQLYPPELYQEGLTVVTVGTVRNLPEAINPRIKSLNYLNNVLAKVEALQAGAQEGLMLNAQGYVAEATGDNVFVVQGRTLTTPPVWCGALEGITRNCVMALARDRGYTVNEEVLSRYDLYIADEVFLTGTAAEIVGVARLDDRQIGMGKPGPVTRDLSMAFGELTRREGTPVQ